MTPLCIFEEHTSIASDAAKSFLLIHAVELPRVMLCVDFVLNLLLRHHARIEKTRHDTALFPLTLAQFLRFLRPTPICRNI